jgi:hypothetical protein
MPATDTNYSPAAMQQGRCDLWLLGAPPADSETPHLTLAGGTPDDAVHPNSIHLGGLAEGAVATASAKVDFQRMDQFAGPVSGIFTEEALKIEAAMLQALDLALVRHILSHGAYTTYTGAKSGKQITVGGRQPLFAFAGTGLNDATRGGRYTGTSVSLYDVKISTAAATDKFQWRKNAGSWSAEISITGAAQALSDGLTIKFLATTGHTLTDYWTITAIPVEPCIAMIAPTTADPTKFVVAVIFRARSRPAISALMSLSKAMQAKLEFEAEPDPDRVAGRRLGVWYVTEAA